MYQGRKGVSTIVGGQRGERRREGTGRKGNKHEVGREEGIKGKELAED